MYNSYVMRNLFIYLYFYIYVGQFAVIAIMVGKVVTQSHCNELIRGNSTAVVDVSKLLADDPLMLCYVDVATALTFVVAFYQASGKHLPYLF